MNDPHKFAVLWPLWEARLADYINGSNLRIDGGWIRRSTKSSGRNIEQQRDSLSLAHIPDH